MIKVTGRPIYEANEKGVITSYRVYTNPQGLECKQFKNIQYESDYSNGEFYRLSSDNGKTWGDWQEAEREDYSAMYGEDEMILMDTKEVWNPVHGHFVSTHFKRYCIEGHEKAYAKEWRGGESVFDHQYIKVRMPEDAEAVTNVLVKYEDGVDFDPENPRNPEYLYKNLGYLNAPIVLKNGDIMVPVGATVETVCKRAGLDVDTVSKTVPHIQKCVIVARGKYNSETKTYDFTFSNPIILSDRQSTRGIAEPVIAELESGRILLIMRASNEIYEGWGCRMEPNSPNFKWYAFSDDGGETFSEALIWHFDNREVIYSSATISEFIRSSKTGKLYWIGNITDHTAHGNMPRYPLCIVEIDENLGIPKKESYTVIDTRREGEPDRVQLSNFYMVEDRETNLIELTLIKYSQFENDKPFFGETWQYDIDIED